MKSPRWKSIPSVSKLTSFLLCFLYHIATLQMASHEEPGESISKADVAALRWLLHFMKEKKQEIENNNNNHKIYPKKLICPPSLWSKNEFLNQKTGPYQTAHLAGCLWSCTSQRSKLWKRHAYCVWTTWFTVFCYNRSMIKKTMMEVLDRGQIQKFSSK